MALAQEQQQTGKSGQRQQGHTGGPAGDVPAEVLDYERSYVERNPGSQRLYREAVEVFPSGVTHDNRFMQPFPIYIERAEGAYKWDVDGHRYIDYVMSWGPLIHGHAPRGLVKALGAAGRLGTSYGAPNVVPCAAASWTAATIAGWAWPWMSGPHDIT